MSLIELLELHRRSYCQLQMDGVTYLTTLAMIFVRVRVSTLQIRPNANVKKPTHQPSFNDYEERGRTAGSSDNSHTSHTGQSQGSIIEPIPNKPYNPPPNRYARRLSDAQLVLWIRDKCGIREDV
jgi:hypothetical protein